MTLVRTAAFYLALVPLTLWHGTIAFLASHRGLHRVADRAGQRWAQTLLDIANIDIDIKGTENIPQETGVVIVSNHNSNIDPLIQFVALKQFSLRYMAKKELYKIPIFRTILKSMNMVRVDRQAGAAGVAELRGRLKTLFDNGHSLVVFPEGTRSRTGVVAPFKKGPFVTANSGNAAVLPVTLVGSDQCWKPGDWLIRSGRVTMVIHSPIRVEPEADNPVEDLRSRAEDAIRETYVRLTEPNQ